jgi:hypothetical protein
VDEDLMTAKKGQRGRPFEPGTLIKKMLDEAVVNDLPDIIKALIDKAKSGDKDCMIYVCDRIMGKPKQAVDMKAEFNIPEGLITQAILEARKSIQAFISEPDTYKIEAYTTKALVATTNQASKPM